MATTVSLMLIKIEPIQFEVAPPSDHAFFKLPCSGGFYSDGHYSHACCMQYDYIKRREIKLDLLFKNNILNANTVLMLGFDYVFISCNVHYAIYC